MSCASQTFAGVTVEKMEAIRAKAASAGLILIGDAGVAEHSGVKLEWSHDPAAGTLTITCVGKPFIVSCGHVNSVIHDLMESCA